MAEEQTPRRRRRTTPRTEENKIENSEINTEKKTSKQISSNISKVKEEKTLRKIRQELQIKFVGCFILGVLLIAFFSKYFFGLLPITAMILYFIVGFSSLKIAAAKSVFADSFYYLGFLFTFAALLFALSGQSSDIIKITYQMGTALSTTVFGMLIRILISHFDPIETEVNNAVSDEMANMATQIRRLTEELTTSIKEQLGAMMTISSASETQLNSINKALEKISNIDTPQESLTRFEDKITSVSLELSNLVNNAKVAKNTLQDFSNSTNNVANALTASSQIVKDSQATASAMNNMSNEVGSLSTNLTQSFSNQLVSMKEMSDLSNKQLTSMNSALENISAINISQDNIRNFDNNISELSNKLNGLISNASEAENKLVEFATSTSAVSSVLATSGKIVANTESTANNLDRLQKELEEIVSSANGEKNKLVSAVAEISNEIKQAKSIITKTSDLSLQMEKTIEDRMANILKLVRNS